MMMMMVMIMMMMIIYDDDDGDDVDVDNDDGVEEQTVDGGVRVDGQLLGGVGDCDDEKQEVFIDI